MLTPCTPDVPISEGESPGVPPPAGVDLDLTTSDIPACEGGRWPSVVNGLYGVDGYTTDSFIDRYPAKKFGESNWFPLDRFRWTICGELYDYRVFDGPGAERDWNLFLIPDRPEPIDRAKEFAGCPSYTPISLSWWSCPVDSGWHKCAGRDCLEAEITPPSGLWQNPWFQEDGGTVLKTSKTQGAGNGQRVCVHGPFVREKMHASRPEIHPSDVVWFREGSGAAETFRLLVLNDASDRFVARGHFSNAPAETLWRPWSAVPRDAIFDIAFEAKPGLEVADLHIRESLASTVVTPNLSETSTDDPRRSVHLIRIDGQVVARVSEEPSADERVAARFTGLCRSDEGSIRGFLRARTRVGQPKSNGEGIGQHGFHVLTITKLMREPFLIERVPIPVVASALPAAQPVKPRLKPVPSSLRRVDVGGAPRLVGDFEVTDGRISGVRVKARREALSRPAATASDGKQTVRDLPLMAIEGIDLTTPGGDAHRGIAAGVEFAPSLRVVAAPGGASVVGVWPAFARAAGAGEVPGVPPGKMVRAEGLRVELIPQYVTARVPGPSDAGVWARQLNDALERGGATVVSLFGAQQPFSATWTLESKDLAVPGTETVPSPGIRTRVADARLTKDGQVQVQWLPSAQTAVTELRWEATMKDPFGEAESMRGVAWSHALRVEATAAAADRLITQVAAMAQLSLPLDASAPQAGLRWTRPPALSGVSALRNFVVGATEDGLVSLGELRQMLEAAKREGRR